MIQNPIPYNGLFHTADSLSDLVDRIMSYSNSSERTIAIQVMLTTMNTCSKIVKEKLEAENV